mmetsp:Transcript_24975/g.77671  ORF Transcript_24975/g.77671 Transcript_24975/m.77671 type:complete len:222 (-) Transcript_24975:203-868(-)
MALLVRKRVAVALEDVAYVPPATAAGDLQRLLALVPQQCSRAGVLEGRPTASGLDLVLVPVERGATAGTSVGPGSKPMQQRPCVDLLSALHAQHPELERSEPRLPLPLRLCLLRRQGSPPRGVSVGSRTSGVQVDEVGGGCAVLRALRATLPSELRVQGHRAGPASLDAASRLGQLADGAQVPPYQGLGGRHRRARSKPPPEVACRHRCQAASGNEALLPW